MFCFKSGDASAECVALRRDSGHAFLRLRIERASELVHLISEVLLQLGNLVCRRTLRLTELRFQFLDFLFSLLEFGVERRDFGFKLCLGIGARRGRLQFKSLNFSLKLLNRRLVLALRRAELGCQGVELLLGRTPIFSLDSRGLDRLGSARLFRR